MKARMERAEASGGGAGRLKGFGKGEDGSLEDEMKKK